MEHEFYEEQEVQSIFWPDGGDVSVGKNCEKITVILECGQMARVPWFAVWKHGKIVSKFNGAMLQGVTV